MALIFNQQSALADGNNKIKQDLAARRTSTGRSNLNMSSLFKSGGKLDSTEKEFAAYLCNISGAKDEESLQKFLLKSGAEEINKIYIDWESNKSKTMEAKNGAKLDYIMKLQGKCPEGFEVEKFMSGGCVKCRKKAMEQGGAASVFKEKCGGKAKKRISKAQKGSTISENDTIHANKQVYNLGNKSNGYKKLSAAEYKKLPVSDKAKIQNKDEASGRSTVASTSAAKPSKKQEGGAFAAFKCGGKTKSRMKKKNMGGTVSNKWSLPTKNEQGGILRPLAKFLNN